MLDQDALVTEYVPQKAPLNRPDPDGALPMPPPEFFRRLEEILTAIHQCGIAHGDIRRRNILWRTDDQPVIIDFATAVRVTPGFAPVQRALFRLLRQADRFGLLRIRYQNVPETLTSEELERFTCPPWFLRIGRFLRHDVYRRFIKQKTWRARVRGWRQSLGVQKG
jgi:serine/threonine protein kinase